MGETEDPIVTSVVSDVKVALHCTEPTDIGLQSSITKSGGYPWSSGSEAVYPHFDQNVFPFLLHNVSFLLVSILRSEMALQGSPSTEVVQAANKVLDILHLIEEIGSNYPWNHIVRLVGTLLPRILCIVSVGLGDKMDNEREFSTLAKY